MDRRARLSQRRQKSHTISVRRLTGHSAPHSNHGPLCQRQSRLCAAGRIRFGVGHGRRNAAGRPDCESHGARGLCGQFDIERYCDVGAGRGGAD